MFSLLACGQGNTPVEQAAAQAANVTPTFKEEVIAEGTPVTFADLSIEGMTCEMMCGGSIKKALAGVPGVVSTEITFAEGVDVDDHAVVTYDPAKVDEATLVKAVQGLHGGQYKVKAVAVTKQVRNTASGTSNTKGNTDDGISASAGSVPSILGLLERLVRL